MPREIAAEVGASLKAVRAPATTRQPFSAPMVNPAMK